ncbi:MAG: histidine--tRNA ligase [Firmicutes bacterium]|nr:histidine--tRNA ligase [Bacillota bacterium]
MISIPKGTKDVLPQDSHKWQYLEDKVRQTAALFNLKEIRTPIFEHTELFLRGIGDTTDVVNKEMYTFIDKGDRSITLKPEGTAAAARSFIENNLIQYLSPLKVFYLTPCLRYERPQAGRLRQHHQFGAEFYGDPSAYADAELISLAFALLTSVGIKDLKVQINSIGCPICKLKYDQKLKKYLDAKKDSLCSTCLDRFEKNPLRILDCKTPACGQVVADAPVILDFVCDDCNSHFELLKHNLTVLNVPFEVNKWIVRGLDYYTKTVFEFVTTALGAQGTVCGGGRYDNLIQSLGGKPTPCVGFGMGLERLLMLMDAFNLPIEPPALDYFIIPLSQDCIEFSLALVQAIRSKNKSADTDFSLKSLKANFKQAEKHNAKNVIVIGDDEVANKEFEIKSQSDGTLKRVCLQELIDGTVQL